LLDMTRTSGMSLTSLWLVVSTAKASGFGGLVVSMLASGTQIRGFKPGRSCRIFRAKNSPSFGGEVKPSVPCHSFVACKKYLQFPWKSWL
jgi:hypothetical protein